MSRFSNPGKLDTGMDRAALALARSLAGVDPKAYAFAKRVEIFHAGILGAMKTAVEQATATCTESQTVSNCRADLREQGLPAPRTCQRCGLGPCVSDGVVASTHAPARAFDGWISVEERLPALHTEVLVWRADSGPFIAQKTTPDAVVTEEEMELHNLEFADDFEEWYCAAYGWQEGSEKPTHWMPLPDGPAPAC